MGEAGTPHSLKTVSGTSQNVDIAIIGIGARLPGAEDYQHFWKALRQGENFIRAIPSNRWCREESSQATSKSTAAKARCQFGSFIDGIEQFDASFFGIHAEEARIMDPQERLSLEVAWACLEDAGYTPEALSRERCGGPVGVFSGVTYNDYQKLIPATNHSCFVNARIAYFFDFQGPSLSVDTGCCSSLTAIEQACQSLARGDCAHALVVGSNLLIHPHHYASLSSLLSSSELPESHPFGRDDGWIPAEGVVAILLKPLDRALADKDHIHGVIKSARTRQEGRTAWLTAPNPRKQAALIREHFEKTGISPRTISYVEVAANGSPMGDAVELEGLTQVFDPFFSDTQRCPIGSVKSGLGHAEAVSTLVQLNRVLLQFKYREILPMVGAHQLNPKIKLERTPFFIPETIQTWSVPTLEIEGRETALPRRATISSFGGGGHMGHLILQEPPARSASTVQSLVCLLPLSAGSPEQLLLTAQRLLAHFTSMPSIEHSLADVMFTLCTGRRVFESRVVFLASSLQDFVYLLRRFLRGESDTHIVSYTTCANPADAWHIKPYSELDQAQRMELAAHWVYGAEIAWSELFKDLDLYRVCLPTYRFSPEHHSIPWVTSKSAVMAPKANIDHVVEVCRAVFGHALNCAPETVDLTSGLDRLGFDSVMVSVVTDGLERDFGPVSQTLLFECRTLQEVIDRVVEKIPKGDFLNTQVLSSPNQGAQIVMRDDIAIIGLAGRFPFAENPQELWENLASGRNCVTEIPANRWNWSEHFEADRLKASEHGNSYGKWGGFLKNHDCFDAMFFNISPREARAMDPQERLFLETAWSAIEDAGYTRASLTYDQRLGSEPKVGVYVGSSWNEYPLFGGHDINDPAPPVSTNACNIANRVSYWFNFKGSSLTLDTACSSSLTALHMACATLRSGENDLVLVGGVNLSLHPNKYRALSQGQFLSSKGLCESFGEGADGYVPSEAVAAVLLKPKSRAIADGDHIYGVIRGSALLHGGKTNGYSVPDPVQQAAVIRAALTQAGVAASEISYIEAHGTGTALGDPIEIAGLTQVFGAVLKPSEAQRASDKCAIGSVKSNLGHCEAASGIVGLTKILLQFKHKKIVASLHSSQLNRRIDFESSRFYVPQQSIPWRIESQPRRIAGLSSFGAGGTNVHVVLEEYVKPIEIPADVMPAQFVILSAWNFSRLKVQVKNLLARLESDAPSSLLDLAYTLQLGREAMPHRLGMVVHSFEQLQTLLRAFLGGNLENVWTGRAIGSVQSFNDDLIALYQQQAYEQILSRWVAGDSVDWSLLWKEKTGQRVSLPTYPFAGDRHWVAAPQQNTAAATLPALATTTVTDVCENFETHQAPACLKSLAFEEVWLDASVPEPDEDLVGRLQRVVCLLSETDNQKAMTSVIKSHHSAIELIFIAQSALLEKDLGTLVAQVGPMDALLYLWPLEQPSCTLDPGHVHSLLQGLGIKGAPLRVLLAGCVSDELARVYLNAWVGFERSLKLPQIS